MTDAHKKPGHKDDQYLSSPDGSEDHYPDAGHHAGLTKYILVFLALLVLTGGSFMTYFQWWHEMFSPGVSRAFMMAISCTKAFLVLMFFMHLKWEANWKYVLTIPACFMSIFLVLMLVPDIGMRTNYYSQYRWTHAAEPNPDEPHAHAAEVEATGDGAESHHP